MSNIAAFVLAFVLAACVDHRSNAVADNGGTLVISATADPGTLFPPILVTTQAKQITEQIYDYLADVGPEMNTRGDRYFRPALSDSWRWSADSLSIAFHINPHARWHDGKLVTARDVRFTFALYRQPELAASVRSELDNIDSVTAADSLTPVFWFAKRSPTQFLDAAAQMLVLPEHQLERLSVRSLREISTPPVGTGRFRLRRWERGSSVEIVADSSNYRGRPKLDRVIWTISPDFPTAVTKLLNGSADVFDALRLENLTDLKRQQNLRTIVIPATDYAFLLFNLRDPRNPTHSHPLFGDPNVRRAITMAIDRVALVRNVFDTIASVPVGPIVRAFPTTDPATPQIPFDSTRARVILDSLGWLRQGTNGIRARGGIELAFTVLVPIASLNRQRMAVLLQEQLRKAGVAMRIEQVDASALVFKLTSRQFDAAMYAWHLGASPDGTKTAWTKAGWGKDGVNYGSYDNPIFDAELDSALDADPDHARELFTRAFATINQDAPAVWLYEPKTIIGIHKRIRIGELRPDAWWIDLGSWHIPPSARLLRDRLKGGS
ncbi:MAG: peptide ABC transporter substrate-binding protein [Gemmatimonadaceae bacterium]